jgi:uncharacterized protein (DUF983 family)
MIWTRAPLKALLLQRCPRCGRGPIFGSLLRMNDDCPLCDLHFEREPGYFLGAMYFSYFMTTLVLSAVFWGAYLQGWTVGWSAGLAVAVLMPLVPTIFRYSRVMWIYFDRWSWPDEQR